MQRRRLSIPGVVYHSEEAAARHTASGAWIWSTIGDCARTAAARAPDKPYVIGEDGEITFGGLDERSESLAASLLDLGLVPGDRAIFQVATVKEIVTALMGCWKAGIIPVCTLPQYREIEIGQLAALSAAKAYIVQADFHPTFDLTAFARQMMAQPGSTLRHLIVLRGDAAAGEHSMQEMSWRYSREEARERTRAADPLPGDVAVFQLSGGSTGVPKIIPRMHAEYLGSSASWNRLHRIGHDDVALWALPLIHNAGMLAFLIPALLEARTLVIRQRFEVDDFLEAIARHRVTYTGSIGPIAPRIIDHPDLTRFDLSSLRTVFTLSRADGFEERTGRAAQQMYGITEGMLMGCAPDAPKEARHGTMGYPAGIGDEVRLLEPGTENDVPEGATGEYCFRGPHTLVAYFDNPEITRQSFTSDGFFRTEDLVSARRIGGKLHYVFEGRLKDNINRGGEKFGAEEVEVLIGRHPAIVEARVVAMPDPELIERACAFLILRPGHIAPSVGELGQFLTGLGLARFKLPERIEVVSEFPVTRVGKVDKKRMREEIAAKLAAERKDTMA